jgi:hypothetical protein
MTGYVDGWGVIERLLEGATDEVACKYRLVCPPGDFVQMREWWRLIALGAWRNSSN